MKTKNLFVPTILWLAFGCVGYNDLPKDNNAANPTENQTTDFSLPEGCTWKPHTEQSNVYVIRSVNDIFPYIDGKFPENLVDFGKHSLIYARGMGTSGIDSITKQLQQVSEKEYLLTVDITNNDTKIAPLWNIAVLVPLIPQDAEVSLNVNAFPKNVTWGQIAQANLYGNGEEGFSQQGIAIKTVSEWEVFKQKMSRANNVVDAYFTETDIDFSAYQIIAVFDEVKGNGGWTIDITGIAEWQDKILISVANLKKGGAASVITQPCQIVKIPVSEKEVEFDKETGTPISGLASKWEIKSQNIAGEMVNISLPPENALYPDISIQIPDTIKGSISGNTFYNSIWVDFEINDTQQISFKSYGGSRIAEDGWGLAFRDNLLNTVKFSTSNNELVFKDSLDKPVIIFIYK